MDNEKKTMLINEIKRLCRAFALLVVAPAVAFIVMGLHVWITEYGISMPEPVQKQIKLMEVEDVFNRHKLRAYRAHNGFVSFETEPQPRGRYVTYTAVFRDTYKKIRVTVENDATYYMKSDGNYEVASSYKNINICNDKRIVTDLMNVVRIYSESKLNGSNMQEIILQNAPAVCLIDTTVTKDGFVSSYADESHTHTEEGFVKFDSDGSIQARYPLPPGFIMATEHQAEELGMFTSNTIYRRVHPRTYIACLDKEGENIFYSCRRPTADGYKEYNFVYHTPTGWIGIPKEIIYASNPGLSQYQAFVISFETAPEIAHIPQPYKTALLVMTDGRPRFAMFLCGDFLPRDFNITGTAYNADVRRMSEKGSDKINVFTITHPYYNWQIVADFKNNSVIFHNGWKENI